MATASARYRVAQWLSLRLSVQAALRLAERLADIQWACSQSDHDAVAGNLSVLVGKPIRWTSPPVSGS